ncbi:MAG: pyruvate oxidase [Chloroflexi bacterium]|nr:pyruvate oxidase [Chloroflexota bacterium]
MATVAENLIDTIADWGVQVVFGLPGDGINGLMEALRKRRHRIRFIQVRHEEAAAFMATAYAKYTGRLGVCLATSGPGAIHLLNGLYDAKMDGAPVLALTGMTYHDLIGTRYQQDVDTQALFRDVSLYDERVMGPAHVENVAHLACRTALARRGVAHLTIPVDVQEWDAGDHRSGRNVPGHTSDIFARAAGVPREEDLQQAADLLNRGRKVAILVGQGALGAGDEVEEAARLLGAPVVKALLGKAVVPDESPYCVGGLGLLGTAPAQSAMEQCDTLLIVGSSFPYLEYLPRPGQAHAVQVDLDPARIGLRYPVEVGLVGDARSTLHLLLPRLKEKTSRGFLERAQAGMRDWWETMDDQATRAGTPIKPQVVAWELGKLLRDDAIVSTDSGTITTWIARHWKLRRGQMFSLAGNLATMACGLPYAIAAQLAYPDRQCIAFVGDGAFSMLMAEFATAVKYALPIKVVVIKNNTLGQIKWEQMVFLGNPEYGVELQPIDFARFAEACGGAGEYVDDPGQVRPALERLLATDGPALLAAEVDPFEPPMPARIKFEQARKFAQALAAGQPNRERIALTIFRDKLDELMR